MSELGTQPPVKKRWALVHRAYIRDTFETLVVLDMILLAILAICYVSSGLSVYTQRMGVVVLTAPVVDVVLLLVLYLRRVEED
jgi:hypothetical protein